MPPERLLVFVKRPRAGEVKTRLGRDLGPEDAAELYRAMAEQVLAATAPAPGGYAREVWFAPAGAARDIAAWLPGETRRAQAGGDLGRRMDGAFASAFARGATRAVLIGTDAPALDRDRVERALDALRDHDLVLGPATDGGYYLIGLGASRPGLFRGVAWSTPAVLQATLERAARAGSADASWTSCATWTRWRTCARSGNASCPCWRDARRSASRIERVSNAARTALASRS